MQFEEIGLHPQVLKAIKEAGYTSPTPIQAQAIPEVLKGSDLRASAQTGTGKTAAFILPCLNRLSVPSEVNGKGPRVLVLVPTRELAMQVAVEAAKYSKYIPRCKTICIYGGAPYPPQNRDLARPHEILVATPGRLIDHMEQGRIDFSRVELFILDEADRMLDMGFIQPVELIASKLPASRQTLMFSATLAPNVMKLSSKLLKNPVEVRVAQEKVSHENIDQRLYRVDSLEHKYRLLDHLLSDPDMTQTIIFTATKRQADHLVEKLANGGRNARALHGGMNQRQRTRTLKEMRQETFDILVATDVAARGIDIQTITHVINFDLPKCSMEDYVHRIGRTGRAGATGTALSFASYKEMSFVRQIEKFTGQKINPHQVPGMEPKPEQMMSPRSAHPEGRRGPPGARGPGGASRFHKKGRPNQAREKPRRWYP
jgi:superfamily II DNA/RNA helicase